MSDVVLELLITEAALDKLGARDISAGEAEQVPRNRHVTVRDPRERSTSARRRLLIGRTDGGRVLTLVIEQTVDPSTWLIVTGWAATEVERTILEVGDEQASLDRPRPAARRLRRPPGHDRPSVR